MSLALPLDLPEPAIRFLAPARQLGAAVCIVRKQCVVAANDEHRRLYPCCDFTDNYPFIDWFSRAVEFGYSTSNGARDNFQKAYEKILSDRKILEAIVPRWHPTGNLLLAHMCIGDFEAQLRISANYDDLISQNDGGVAGLLQSMIDRKRLSLMINSINIGISIISYDGVVLKANNSFLEEVQKGDCIKLDSEMKITTTYSEDYSILSHFLRTIVEVKTGLVLPLRRHSGKCPKLLSMELMPFFQEPAILLKLAESREDLTWIEGIFRKFGATEAESHVLAEIGSGLSIKDIAERDSLSEGTIRNQLQYGRKKLRRFGLDISGQRHLSSLFNQLASISPAKGWDH